MSSKYRSLRTLTLPERVDLLHRTALNSHETVSPAASRRETRWRERCTDSQFEYRIRQTGIRHNQIRSILDTETLEQISTHNTESESASTAQSGPTPGSEPLSTASLQPASNPHVAAISTHGPHSGMLNLVQPQLMAGAERFAQHLSSLPNLAKIVVSANDLGTIAVANLASILGNASIRVLTLELNVMRLQNRLSGKSAGERYQSFTRQLNNNELRNAIFHEYPVLLRIINQSVERWLKQWTQITTRFAEDHDEITKSIFQSQTPGLLQHIHNGQGDPHRGGQQVAILTFNSGRKLVYKPRSLKDAQAWNSCLTWLYHKVGESAPAQPALLLRDTYGWSGFVEHRACNSKAEISRFYQRLGLQLSLLHTLKATDMHMENIIASGSSPVIVDLEALFHAQRPTDQHNEPTANIAPDDLQSAWQSSVMRIGLLPSWSYMKPSGDAIDMSGLSGKEGQLLPELQPAFKDLGKDTMHLGQTQAHTPASQNRPFLKASTEDPAANGPTNPASFATDIVSGFRKGYAAILDNRNQLTAANSLFENFKNVEFRAVLRNTATYATLLRDSTHPDMLRDAIDRDIHFDVLWRSLNMRPWMKNVIQHELHDLNLGDIPYFTSRPSSRSLWSSTGQEIPAVFNSTPLADIHTQLAAMSTKDCERQCWLIEASLSILTPATHNATATNTTRNTRLIEPANASREALLQQAQNIANRIRDIGFITKTHASWLGLAPVNDKRWVLQPANEDVYSGRPGIGLFLLEAAQALQNHELASLATLALDNSADTLEKLLHEERNNQSAHAPTDNSFLGGAYGLFAGNALIFAHAANIRQNKRYQQLATQLIQRAAMNIENDSAFDVISGSAGLALVAAAIAKITPDFNSSHILHHILNNAASHLVAKATHSHSGLAWTGNIQASQPLSGFSHGNSGIALALLKAAVITSNADFWDAAQQAVHYEHQLMLQNNRRWLDYRIIDNTHWNQYAAQTTGIEMHAWCHGTPGIALARLRMLEITAAIMPDHDEFQSILTEDLNEALRQTLSHGILSNDSLCHGLSGNLLVLDAAWRAGNPNVPDSIRHQLVSKLASDIQHRGPRPGVPNCTETPGLMTGLAGIGLALLQLAGEPVLNMLDLTTTGTVAI